MSTKSLSFTETVQATPAAVYRAFTNANMLTQWLCNDARLAVQEGGRLYLYWPQGYYTVGEFTAVEADKSLAFSWLGKGEQDSSTVQITLTKVDDGTTVALEHTDVAESHAADIEKNWQDGLANLKSVLEKGLDKRVYDRPFMGILINSIINAEQLAKQGIPAKGAVQISGTLPRTGAAEAGLQRGDLITIINGAEITSFPAIGQALGSGKIGDRLPIEYYRDGEKHAAEMELRSRPAPDRPETAAAFAETLQGIYAELDAELDDIFAGVSEEEAATPPAEGEWSAQEVIAHLIVTERAAQIGVGAQLGDTVLVGYPNNDPPLLRAILTAYPTTEALLEAWKRAEAETVILVKNLPESYTERLVDYLALSLNLLQGLPAHTRGHFIQIQEAIATVREKLEPVAA